MTTIAPDNTQLAKEAHIYDPKTFFDKGEEGKDAGSVLFQFIKSLKPGMDMTSIMCPTFCIRPISFLEFLTIYTQPNSTLLHAASETNAEKRMIDMATWVLSTLTITPQNGFAGIKPYNPILGEEFHCHWDHDDGSQTVLHAEQVSHHPPITALNFRNEKHGIRYVSTGEFKAKFRGNYVDSAVEGNHVLELTKFDEAYEVTWPTMVARGILWGNARIEHGSNLIIYCAKTGYKTQVNFDKSDHKLSGHIFKGKDKIYKIDGELTGQILLIDEKNKHNKQVLIDHATQKREKYIVPEITTQSPYDSRRVWHTVTYAIKTGDLDKAAKCKTEIEEHQRRLAKARKEKGETWSTKLFDDTHQRTATNVPVYTYKEDGDRPFHMVHNDSSSNFANLAPGDDTKEVEDGVGQIDLDLD
jgi:hypothetical protein